MPFSRSRLHAVVGTSTRLRDQALAPLRAAWTGQVHRLVEPGDVGRLALDLDTPSLFGEPTLWLVRADEAWVKRHKDILLAMVGRSAANGALVLMLPTLDGREAVTKALAKADALHEAEPPWAGGKPWEIDQQVAAWVVERLAEHGPGAQQPGKVADLLVGHLGGDVDALCASIEALAVCADEQPITPRMVEELITGSAARPIWEMIGAVVEGRAGAAIEQFHAGDGNAHGALGALVGELRKLLACRETRDDAEAARLAGLKGRASLYHVRRRAGDLPAGSLPRLVVGVLLAQRQVRQGVEPALAFETLVLHAQRVVRPARPEIAVESSPSRIRSTPRRTGG